MRAAGALRDKFYKETMTMDEIKKEVPPEQGITVGRIVHYTDANRESGRMEPTDPLPAMVLEVNKYTGKPTLKVDRLYPSGLAPKGTAATQGGARVLATMLVEEVEFSKEPAGSMAARGCWSWPVIATPPTGWTAPRE